MGARGVVMTAKIAGLKFDEAAADVVNDYKLRGLKSGKAVARRIRLHLQPVFGGRKLASISATDIRNYTMHRLEATEIGRGEYTLKTRRGSVTVKASKRTVAKIANGTVNRELQILKRIFNLAMQNGRILTRPHIKLLREDDTIRQGFITDEQFSAIHAHLPTALQPVLEFAYVTGWRTVSEILPLQWRNVDFSAGEVRLDPGVTKNRQPRIFPLTNDLRRLLETQRAEHLRLKKAGHVCPYVFFREIASGRGGPKAPKPIIAFTKAWRQATKLAGCPGRIPHDLRRTAIRTMVRRGVPEVVAMRLCGHETRSIFDRYAIVSELDLRTAADRLSSVSGTLLGHQDVSAVETTTEFANSFRKTGGAARN